MSSDVKECSTIYSEYHLLMLGLMTMSEASTTLTPAIIMAASSQPKFEMRKMRVHTLKDMKIQDRIRKAMVSLYVCTSKRATSASGASMLPWPAGKMDRKRQVRWVGWVG
jgi:hypothetical protein